MSERAGALASSLASDHERWRETYANLETIHKSWTHWKKDRRNTVEAIGSIVYDQLLFDRNIESHNASSFVPEELPVIEQKQCVTCMRHDTLFFVQRFDFNSCLSSLVKMPVQKHFDASKPFRDLCFYSLPLPLDRAVGP